MDFVSYLLATDKNKTTNDFVNTHNVACTVNSVNFSNKNESMIVILLFTLLICCFNAWDKTYCQGKVKKLDIHFKQTKH